MFAEICHLNFEKLYGSCDCRQKVRNIFRTQHLHFIKYFNKTFNCFWTIEIVLANTEEYPVHSKTLEFHPQICALHCNPFGSDWNYNIHMYENAPNHHNSSLQSFAFLFLSSDSCACLCCYYTVDRMRSITSTIVRGIGTISLVNFPFSKCHTPAHTHASTQNHKRIELWSSEF